jgi:hypothetical protein
LDIDYLKSVHFFEWGGPFFHALLGLRTLVFILVLYRKAAEGKSKRLKKN